MAQGLVVPGVPHFGFAGVLQYALATYHVGADLTNRTADTTALTADKS